MLLLVLTFYNIHDFVNPYGFKYYLGKNILKYSQIDFLFRKLQVLTTFLLKTIY